MPTEIEIEATATEVATGTGTGVGTEAATEIEGGIVVAGTVVVATVAAAGGTETDDLAGMTMGGPHGADATEPCGMESRALM